MLPEFWGPVNIQIHAKNPRASQIKKRPSLFSLVLNRGWRWMMWAEHFIPTVRGF